MNVRVSRVRTVAGVKTAKLPTPATALKQRQGSSHGEATTVM